MKAIKAVTELLPKLGTGNKEQGTGVWEQVYRSFPLEGVKMADDRKVHLQSSP